MLLSKPNDFTANTTISSSEVNDNFDTLYNGVNGNLDANNLASGAVTTAKIADSNVTTAKIADGAVTVAKRAGGFYAGTFNVTANGDQAITGVGFTPKAIIFVAFPATADTVGSGANAGLGVGFVSAVGTEVSGAATARPGQGGGVELETASSFVVDTIAIGGGTQTKSFQGDLKSLDADGFTVTISNYTASGTVLYLAMG